MGDRNLLATGSGNGGGTFFHSARAADIELWMNNWAGNVSSLFQPFLRSEEIKMR